MAALKRTAPAVAGFLSMGKMIGSDGVTYRWEAPAAMSVYAEMLNKEDRRELIVAALTEASGVESKFEAVVAGSAATVDNSEASLLAGLEETFSKANVMIQEE